MPIATNVVLLALLTEASSVVTNLHLPLDTPLKASSVRSVRFYPVESDGRLTLGAVVFYTGGFTFWHEHGATVGFSRPSAYINLVEIDEAPRYVGTIRHSEKECLAAARDGVSAFGFPNVPLLAERPLVNEPPRWKDGVIPQYVFEWKSDSGMATVVVNAEVSEVEYILLSGGGFRKGIPIPWPESRGVAGGATRQAPGKHGLVVKGAEESVGIAFVEKCVPHANRICSVMGIPPSGPFSMADVDLDQSEVTWDPPRSIAVIRLKDGYRLHFANGRFSGVRAPITHDMDPPYPEEFLQSQEYLGEAKVTEKQAAERVRSILVNRMHLDSRGFKFGAEPQFTYEPNPKAVRGMRRFVFEWPPAWATEATKPRDVTPASIIAEVDAVSGDVKALLFWDTIFDGDGWAKLGFP